MKKTFITLGIILATTAVIIGLTLWFIRYYTGHDDALVKVPVIEGLNMEKALRILEDQGYEYEITDTVFREGYPLLAIVDQTPDAESEVKKGRKIYLVLNTNVIPEVEVPDLAGKSSYAIAVRRLENRGLIVGKKIKKPIKEIKDPNSEPVLGMRLAGDSTEMPPKTRVKRGTKIDLVVGSMIETDVFVEDDLLVD
ncbi:MAG: beta-lactam-binding protein with PASTA domain [Bacteroidia bacterium]|jgi:beta-lactam-binding protein with PASTA domain